MHRKPLFLFVCLCVITSVIQSQNTFVPDDNFEQALIDLGLDSAPLNDFVPTANIATITNLDIESKNINDLTGIEDFTALTILNCSNNNLTSLNVSTLNNLTELYCNSNAIASINLASLPFLKIFWCDNNELLELDVTRNLNLISLVCDSNFINSLDVLNNVKLNTLSCVNNNLTSLNISENTTLNALLISSNKLVNLDLKENNNLTILDCSFNNLTSLNIDFNKNLKTINCSNNLLAQLDAFNQDDLRELHVNNNDLCVLNIKNGTNSSLNTLNFEANPNLSCVVVDNIENTYSNWEPSNFTNYVNSVDDCSVTIPIDSLNNFIGISYTLPEVINGNYFTEPNGNGVLIQAGEVINTTQTIYIFNETVCDSNQSFFNVTILNDAFYIPKYFTPNNDGNHDFWQVYDTLNLIERINVFNRHGKLLKVFNTDSIGWDGTHEGQLLPSTDYWYVITLKTNETLKGHFTLKR